MKRTELSLALWRRLSWIGWALMVLFWIPLEEVSPHGALFLAGITMGMLAARAGSWKSAARLREKIGQIGVCSLQGGMAGLLTTPLTLFLMILKSGLHAHTVPEYSYAQFQWVLVRMPVWIAAGALIGLACGLLAIAKVEDGSSKGV